MNRFAAAGLVVEALVRGKSVLVLTPHPSEVGATLDCIARVPECAEWPGVRVRRQNGEQQIEFDDLGRAVGRIVVRSVRSSLRGMSADVVYIDDEADRRLDDGRRDQLYRDARAIVAASPHGEIVRA